MLTVFVYMHQFNLQPTTDESSQSSFLSVWTAADFVTMATLPPSSDWSEPTHAGTQFTDLNRRTVLFTITAQKRRMRSINTIHE